LFLKVLFCLVGAVFECREWRQRAGVFSSFKTASGFVCRRCSEFRGGFSGAFQVKGQRVFGVQALFARLTCGAGSALVLLQFFRAVPRAGRGNRSAFLRWFLPKQAVFSGGFWKMDVVRKSNSGSAPQFCGGAFSRLGAQVLLSVCLFLGHRAGKVCLLREV